MCESNGWGVLGLSLTVIHPTRQAEVDVDAHVVTVCQLGRTRKLMKVVNSRPYFPAASISCLHCSERLFSSLNALAIRPNPFVLCNYPSKSIPVCDSHADNVSLVKEPRILAQESLILVQKRAQSLNLDSECSYLSMRCRSLLRVM